MFKINFKKPDTSCRVVKDPTRESSRKIARQDDTVEQAQELKLKNEELLEEVIESILK